MPAVKGKRRGGKRGGKRRGAKKGGRRMRKTRNVSEYASLSETVTLSVNNGPVVNTLYSLMNTSLSQYSRATMVAKAYQHYRIKYIQLRFKPSFDTYLVNQAAPNSKPNLYYIIDKAGAVPTNITLAGLKAMGAKPRAFDEKPLTVGWRPSVLEQVLTAGGPAPLSQGSRYQISPWLNTNASTVDIALWNPSTVDHLGVYWFMEQNFSNPSPQPYTVEVEVQFEFKKPLMATAIGAFHAVPVAIAALNQSRDGIVDSRPDGDDNELP